MTEEQLRDLIERHHRIKQVTDSDGFQLLRDYAAAQIEAKQRSLLQGSHDDLMRYKYDAGFVQGALAVLNAAETLEAQIDRARKLRAAEAADAA